MHDRPQPALLPPTFFTTRNRSPLLTRKIKISVFPAFAAKRANRSKMKYMAEFFVCARSHKTASDMHFPGRNQHISNVPSHRALLTRKSIPHPLHTPGGYAHR